MQTNELIEYLQTQTKKNLILELSGIITTTIKIENMQMKSNDYAIFFESINDISLKLNLKQLMKISKVKENAILLEFDQLQNVTITVENL